MKLCDELAACRPAAHNDVYIYVCIYIRIYINYIYIYIYIKNKKI